MYHQRVEENQRRGGEGPSTDQ